MSKTNHILVVEDDDDIMELIRFNCEREGLVTAAARSAEQALRLVEDTSPALILVDLMLPGMDGLALCRVLKSNVLTRGVPIVMVTAKGEETDIIAGLEQGAEDYITKPFSPRVLIARIKAVLRRHGAEVHDRQAPLTVGELTIHPGRREVRSATARCAHRHRILGPAVSGQPRRLGVHPQPARRRGARTGLPGDRPLHRRADRRRAQEAGHRQPAHRNRPRRRLPFPGRHPIGGSFDPMRPAGVTVTVTALAAVAAAAGAAAYALQHVAATVAAALLVAGSVGVAALSLWRLCARPAARGAQMLAAVAGAGGHGGRGGQSGAPLEALAAQVRERLAQLERSHQRLQAVIRDLPQGVLVFDRDGALLEINRTGMVMLGASTAVAGVVGIAGIVHGTEPGPDPSADSGADGQSAAAQVVDRYGLAAVAQRALRGENAEVDIPVRGAETRWLQAHGQLSGGPDGERGALLVLHDVTRLRHLEQVRRDFVDNVSHELRTPFTLVNGFAETLLDGDMCPNPEARHFLEIIHKHSARVSAIIDDLLLLAHIERAEDRSGISFEDALLAPVISAVLLSCGRTAKGHGVALHEVCDAGLTCRMNALLIEQAITNLVDNAITYSSRDTGVTVRGLRRGGGVVVEVIDTGLGIAQEYQQRIFERFYRVDAARSRDSGGTGLGLAIVKHIAQAHAGEVTVRSAPGRGSTFTLRLPG